MSATALPSINSLIKLNCIAVISRIEPEGKCD